MTSSATQTDGDGRAAPPHDRLERWIVAHVVVLVGVALAVIGCVAILAFNRWWFGPPVVFLCLGWLAILAAGWGLWRSAQSAAGEGDAIAAEEARDAREGFVVSETRREELEREKRALLKAIKEVEFDREMGKMSDSDAADIVKVYRARAIEILKELDQDEGGEGAAEEETVEQKIEREVRARLALAGIKEGKGKKKKEEQATGDRRQATGDRGSDSESES